MFFHRRAFPLAIKHYFVFSLVAFYQLKILFLVYNFRKCHHFVSGHDLYGWNTEDYLNDVCVPKYIGVLKKYYTNINSFFYFFKKENFF